MILFSSSIVLYPIQSLQLKQKQQPDQMVPPAPPARVCACVHGEKRNASFQAGTQ